jgi:hypothetical protein
MSRTQKRKRTTGSGFWGFLEFAPEFFHSVLNNLRNYPLLTAVWGIAVLFFLFLLATFVLAGELPLWGKVILVMTAMLVLGGLLVLLIRNPLERHQASELAHPPAAAGTPIKKSGDTFQLRYLWLDATASSFLIANRFDPGLERVLPANPIVVHNAVFQKLGEIVTRFGHMEELLLDPNMSNYQYLQTSGNEVSYINGKWRGPREVGQLRLYAAEDDIIWPDEVNLRTVFKTTDWPSDYDMTYEEPFDVRAWEGPEDSIDFQNEAISCVRLHAPISAQMLKNYDNSMRELERAIVHEEFKRSDVTNIRFPPLSDMEKFVARNKSIDAMLYYGEGGWPNDFLIAFGNAWVGGCGHGTEYDYRFGFYVKPRKLYTLVAIIEPRGDDTQIERLRYSIDGRQQLRTLKRGGKSELSASGVVTIIKKGEMAVVPLRIELRYEVGAFGLMADDEASKKIHDRIKDLGVSALDLTGRERDFDAESGAASPLKTVFSKSVSSFRTPKSVTFTPTYVFGPSFELEGLTIQGTEVAVRPAPADFLNYLGRAPVGSCPFLFISNGMTEPNRVGRVLIGASRKDLARIEELRLPKGTSSFFITEQEPEVTHLAEVTVIDHSSKIEQIIASEVVLRPGEAREFFIPKEFTGEITLKLSGYYEPLHYA